MTAAPIEAAWCSEYLGIPFLDGGRSLAGFDCWGLVWWLVTRRDGLPLPDLKGTYRALSVKETTAIAEAGVKGLVRIGTEGERAGDVIHLRGARGLNHVGYCVAPGWMLHVERGALTWLTAFREHAVWRGRVLGVYRHEALVSRLPRQLTEREWKALHLAEWTR